MLQKTKMTFLRLFAIIGFVVLFAIASISLASCSSDSTLTASSMSINSDGELVVTYSDGTTQNLGTVVGEDGEDGATGATGSTGAKGDTGDTGSAGVGITGIVLDGDNLVISYTSGDPTTIDISSLINAGGTATDTCSHSTWKVGYTIEANTSCTEEGGLAIYYCVECGDVKIGVLAANEHDYEKITIDSTCTAQGYTHWVCKNCHQEGYAVSGDVYSEGNYVDVNGAELTDQTDSSQYVYKYNYTELEAHTYTYELAADSNTYSSDADASYTYTVNIGCSVCGTVDETETVTLTNSDFTVTTAAGCETTGVVSATVSLNDASKGYSWTSSAVTLTTPTTGHTSVSATTRTATAATCAVGNAALYYCSACEKYLIKVDANGDYTYTVDESTGDVTETGEYWKTTTLTSVNDANITKTIAEGGLVVAAVEDHTWDYDNPVISTVYEGSDGSSNACLYGYKKVYECTVCGAHKEDGQNPGVGYHTVAVWTVKPSEVDSQTGEVTKSYAPTTTEAGTLVGTCTLCGETVEITIPAISVDNGWVAQNETSCTTATDVKYVYTIADGTELTTDVNAISYLSERAVKTVLAEGVTENPNVFDYTINVAATGHTYVSGSVTIENLASGSYINLQATTNGSEEIDGTTITYYSMADTTGLHLTTVESGKNACSSEGYYQNAFYICDDCGTYIYVYVRTAHGTEAKVSETTEQSITGSDGQTYAYTASTCTVNGHDYTYCTVCNSIISTITLDLADHTYAYALALTDGTTSEATEGAGYTYSSTSTTYALDSSDNYQYVTYCTVCGEVISTKTLTSSMMEDNFITVATCNNSGLKNIIVTFADGTTETIYNVEVAATGHYITVYTVSNGAITGSEDKWIPTTTTGDDSGTVYISNTTVNGKVTEYYAYYTLNSENNATKHTIYQYSSSDYDVISETYDGFVLVLSEAASGTYSCVYYGTATVKCANGCTVSGYIDVTNVETDHDYSKVGGTDTTDYIIYTADITLVNTTTTGADGNTYTYRYYIIAPTCTSTGYSVYSCSICGGITYDKDVTEALGHTYVATEITDGTYGAASYDVTLICSVCGETTQLVNYNYTLTVTVPTGTWSEDTAYSLDSNNQAYKEATITVTNTDGSTTTWKRTTYYADETNAAKVVYVITNAYCQYGSVGTITITATGVVDTTVHVYQAANGTVYLIDEDATNTYTVYTSNSKYYISELGDLEVTINTTASISCTVAFTGTVTVTCLSYGGEETITLTGLTAEHDYVYLTAANYATYAATYSVLDGSIYAYAANSCTEDETIYMFCLICQNAELLVAGHTYEIDGTTYTVKAATGHTYKADYETSDDGSTFTITLTCSVCGTEMDEITVNRADLTLADTIVGDCATATQYVYNYTIPYTVADNANGNSVESVKLIYADSADVGEHTPSSYDLLGNPVTYTYTYYIDNEYHRVTAYICSVCGHEAEVEHLVQDLYPELTDSNNGTYTADITLWGESEDYTSSMTYVEATVTVSAAGIYTLSISDLVANSGDSDLAWAYIYDSTTGAYTYVNYSSYWYGDWGKTSYIINSESVDFNVALWLEADTKLTIYIVLNDYDTDSAQVTITLTQTDYTSVDNWLETAYGLTAVTDTSFTATGSTLYSYTATAEGLYTFSTSDGDVKIYTDLYDDYTGEAYYWYGYSYDVTVALAAGDVVYITNYTDYATTSTVTIDCTAVTGIINESVEQVIDKTELYKFVVTESGKYILTYDSSSDIYYCTADDSSATNVYGGGSETLSLSAGDVLYIWNYSSTGHSTVTIAKKQTIVISYTGFDGTVYNISDYTGSTYTAGTTLIDGVLSISDDSGRLTKRTECTYDDAFAISEAGAIYEGVDLDTSISINPVLSGTGSLTFVLSADSNVTFYFGLGTSSVTFQVVDAAGNVYISVNDSDATTAYNILSASANLAAGTYIIKTEARGTAYLYSIAVGESTGTIIVPAVTVSAVTVSSNATTLAIGATETLECDVTMSDASAYTGTVTWTSSDTSIATVDANGMVTAIASGTVTITATADSKTGTVTLKITGVDAVVNISTLYPDASTDITLTTATTLYSGTDGTSVTVNASSSKTVVIDDNSKSIDGYSFVSRLKLGGAGDADARSIEIELVAGATITVYAMSSSSGSTRILALYDDEFSAIDATQSDDGTSITKYTFTVTEGGTYYIASTSGGLNVYGIVIDY